VKIAHVTPEQERQRTNSLAATHSPLCIAFPMGKLPLVYSGGSEKFNSFIGMPEWL
jgi:hypothetical protein